MFEHLKCIWINISGLFCVCKLLCSEAELRYAFGAAATKVFKNFRYPILPRNFVLVPDGISGSLMMALCFFVGNCHSFAKFDKCHTLQAYVQWAFALPSQGSIVGFRNHYLLRMPGLLALSIDTVNLVSISPCILNLCLRYVARTTPKPPPPAPEDAWGLHGGW